MNFGFHAISQASQNAALFSRQSAGGISNHTQRANPVAILCGQRRSGIEPDVRRANDQGVVRKAFISAGIFNFQNLAIQNGMGTERHITRCFTHLQPLMGLEPLPFRIYQGNQRHWHMQHLLRQLGKPLKPLLFSAIEQPGADQCLYALFFVCR